jgi:hypothetical protein
MSHDYTHTHTDARTERIRQRGLTESNTPPASGMRPRPPVPRANTAGANPSQVSVCILCGVCVCCTRKSECMLSPYYK